MADAIECPGCRQSMARENFGNVHADVCTGCRGIWFDRGELERLDHSTKGMGPYLDEALATPRASDEERGGIDCPHCDGPMDQLDYEFAEAVTIDECAGCCGVFLDAGELAAIRARRLSQDEVARICARRRRRRRRRNARQTAERDERNTADAVFSALTWLY